VQAAAEGSAQSMLMTSLLVDSGDPWGLAMPQLHVHWLMLL
jgi:hypothetical protein